MEGMQSLRNSQVLDTVEVFSDEEKADIVAKQASNSRPVCGSSTSSEESGVNDEDSVARKRERRRVRIIREILDTEDTYQKHLGLIVEYFEEPLRELKLIPDHVIVTIFSNIKQIININKELRQHLKVEPIGKAFTLMGPFLKLYSTYANNHERALAALMEWDQNSAEFSDFRRRQEDTEEFNGLKLNALLITPVQRVPRYKMLLEDLLYHTDSNHHDYQLLQDACTQMGAVAQHINEHIKQQDNFMKMLAIQKSLVGPLAPKILTPGRMFIKDGRLKKVSKNGGRSHERMFFLFSDVLMYAKPKFLEKSSTHTYNCCCILPLHHCTVQRVFGHTQGHSALFTIQCKEESLLLYSDQKTVDKWIKSLTDAIGKFVENRQSLRKESSAKVPVRRGALAKYRKEQELQDPLTGAKKTPPVSPFLSSSTKSPKTPRGFLKRSLKETDGSTGSQSSPVATPSPKRKQLQEGLMRSLWCARRKRNSDVYVTPNKGSLEISTPTLVASSSPRVNSLPGVTKTTCDVMMTSLSQEPISDLESCSKNTTNSVIEQSSPLPQHTVDSEFMQSSGDSSAHRHTIALGLSNVWREEEEPEATTALTGATVKNRNSDLEYSESKVNSKQSETMNHCTSTPIHHSPMRSQQFKSTTKHSSYTKVITKDNSCTNLGISYINDKSLSVNKEDVRLTRQQLDDVTSCSAHASEDVNTSGGSSASSQEDLEREKFRCSSMRTGTSDQFSISSVYTRPAPGRNDTNDDHMSSVFTGSPFWSNHKRDSYSSSSSPPSSEAFFPHNIITVHSSTPTSSYRLSQQVEPHHSSLSDDIPFTKQHDSSDSDSDQNGADLNDSYSSSDCEGNDSGSADSSMHTSMGDLGHRSLRKLSRHYSHLLKNEKPTVSHLDKNHKENYSRYQQNASKDKNSIKKCQELANFENECSPINHTRHDWYGRTVVEDCDTRVTMETRNKEAVNNLYPILEHTDECDTNRSKLIQQESEHIPGWTTFYRSMKRLPGYNEGEAVLTSDLSRNPHEHCSFTTESKENKGRANSDTENNLTKSSELSSSFSKVLESAAVTTKVLYNTDNQYQPGCVIQ